MTEPGPRSTGRGLLKFALATLSLTFFFVIGCRSFDLGFNTSQRIDPRADHPAGPPSGSLPRFQQKVPPYHFFSDFDLKDEKGLLDDLLRLRDRLSQQLQLPPSSATIQVYIFEDQERYRAYISKTRANLPERRALFVRQGRAVGTREDFLIYTYRTDRLAQDLRHELTHAFLNSVIHKMPLWLDEGLAEYFELPPERNGVNAEHVRLLRNPPVGQFKPDMARLETLTEVDQMKLPEYREAWAWVHLLFHGKPEGRQALLTYLQDLRERRPGEPFVNRLGAVYPELNAALHDHIARLDAELARSPRKPMRD